jgi:hypothetical protein
MINDPSLILFAIAAVIVLNLIWVIITINIIPKYRPHPAILSEDPILPRLITVTRTLTDYDPDTRTRKSVGEARETLHQIALNISELGSKYRLGKLKIERFASLGFRYISTSINRSYVRGQERHFLSIPRKQGVIFGIENLVDSIQLKNAHKVYDAIADLIFVVEFGDLPYSVGIGSTTDKKSFAKELEKMFVQVISNAENVLYDGRPYFFRYMKNGANRFSDSHLLTLYVVMRDYQERFIGKRKSHKRLLKYFRGWLDAWISNKINSEYTLLAKMMTVAQKEYGYIEEASYIDKSL